VGGCIRKTTGLSRWGGIEEQVSLDWTGDSDLVTLLGVDGRAVYAGSQLDLIDKVTEISPQPVGYVRKTEYEIGIYLQQTAKPWSFLDLSAGARLDAGDRIGSHLSPRAAANLHVWTGGTLKGIYAEAFRAPTIYEIYFADPTYQIDSRSLKPETVRSAEAVFEQRYGTHRFLVAGFRSWWREMVTLDNLTPPEINAAITAKKINPGVTAVVQYRNVASIDDTGFNAAFEGTQFRGILRYGLNLTVASAKRTLADGTSVDLTVTPKVFGNARLSLALPGDLPVLSVVALMFGERLADRANDGSFTPTPYAPRQLEFRGTLAGPFPGIPGLSYRVTADVATSNRNPYVVGPNQAAADPMVPTPAELSPIDTFRVGVGLQYDFGR
jgi:hypothetical protein